MVYILVNDIFSFWQNNQHLHSKLETVLQIFWFSMFIREVQDFLWQGLEINLLAIVFAYRVCSVFIITFYKKFNYKYLYAENIF